MVGVTRWDSRLAGIFPSSSDAPVCASLVWAAFGKSGLLAHPCEEDRVTTTYAGRRYGRNHTRCRRWPSAYDHSCPENRNLAGRRTGPVLSLLSSPLTCRQAASSSGSAMSLPMLPVDTTSVQTLAQVTTMEPFINEAVCLRSSAYCVDISLASLCASISEGQLCVSS